MSREPLAALVARLRNGLAWAHEFDASGTNESPFQAGPIIENEDATRLLAAVEAGTKCADAIATVLRSGPDAIVGARAEFRSVRPGRGSAITVRFDEMRAALDGWAKVAEAPASHGSPEQGR